MPEEMKPKRQTTEDPAVTKFRQYLRIKTVHPEPDYESAVDFLRNYAVEIGLPCKTVEVQPGKEIVIMTLEGQEPSLPSVMLNSHTDVVPVFPDEWKCDPFAAEKMENGDIYGRGTQDMKASGIQYMEAVRKIKAEKGKLLRTLHLTFVPDEEIGGFRGMALFVDHEEFKKLNIGFVIDEGLANPTDAFTVFYGERAPWWVEVRCVGNPGHGSRFIENTAAEKFRKVINSFLDFRAQEEKKLKGNSCLRLGDVTTVNLTKVQGGIAMNVVPMEMTAVVNTRFSHEKVRLSPAQPHGFSPGTLVSSHNNNTLVPISDPTRFDIRVTPGVDMEEFDKKIRQWCADAGDDVHCEFVQKFTACKATSIEDEDPWWNAFSTACKQMGMTIETEIFPAATDSRYIRAIGLPAIGFSPMNNTPILLHDHNEFQNEDVFLKGIDIFINIVVSLGSVPK